jgi:hypothetical protein
MTDITPGASASADAKGKPTPDDLGIDLARLTWQRSGDGDGSIEIAFPLSARWPRGDWVLMRVAGDPAARVLVFDRNEWECFIDGARNGEFDDAAVLSRGRPPAPRRARPRKGMNTGCADVDRSDS